MTTAFAQHWLLDPQVDYLNHGSFGACPRPVLDEQQRLRDLLERQPVEFLVRRLPDLHDAARRIVAEFVGADAEGLVAVTNATSGVNAVLRSLDLRPGDELLTTDHAYSACRFTLDFVAERARARVVSVPVPFPLADGREVIEALVAAAGERTRLALVDHVTSPTGIVLPVEAIVAALRERGIDTLVDGAHAPGMLPLRVAATGAAYYVGNCHKWLCAPKGAGFLWVREDRRESVRPLTISHGAQRRRAGRSRLHDEFDWTGTTDPTPFLCVPTAIAFMGGLLDGGWPELMRHNRALLREARRILAAALSIDPPCPEEMLGTLAALPLPEGARGSVEVEPEQLQLTLLREHGVEAPVYRWPEGGRHVIRVSAQIYNEPAQYERLARALVRELSL